MILGIILILAMVTCQVIVTGWIFIEEDEKPIKGIKVGRDRERERLEEIEGSKSKSPIFNTLVMCWLFGIFND